MTEWRSCQKWSDFEVSDDGQIRRIRGPKWAKLMQPRALPIGSNGYVMLRLSQEGRAETVTLHTLICEAFHGPKPTPDHYAVHWDGVRVNNSASNLRWATPRENTEDARRHGTLTVGVRNGHAILTETQVKEIRAAYAAFKTYRGDRRKPAHLLARRFGVTAGCIKSIVRNENWKHIR